eukprot:COSAG04_NODE_28955_length_272_cov_0.601156_1_plen_68_part_01
MIFDHNSAVVAAAVWIDGRAGWPVPTDPTRQNWESGISWIVRACTFFRNYANAFAAHGVYDVWPLEIS